ncbi:LmbU family transcriptional regulator [Alloactinosynnema sp. L-07]|uniref:LmbU family transcriptional regulator n=1 Tax=Alloactinosynnema sp. L-07 TaxID=1653480 RepID=UPI001E32241C
MLAFDRWERAGHQIFRIVDSSAWCLGDWLLYGQEQYADRYRQAVEAAGLDYQTLRNYAWVARKFELDRRRHGLSFQHHAEVAALPAQEQDQWLTRAEQARWSRNQLRNQIRESRKLGGDHKVDNAALPRLNVEQERIERWRKAARISDTAFEHWVLTALDSAATQELEEAAG